ncbi:hypothetical protein [Hymenobacter nivis]|uniref:Uncharacterized protein n=1 Tax=Hymenobacter nivis TaxID=1850093 RepID=A0A2Z3GFU1_9BACT|nr:hypothetical protein [Hymenobacter nivis]AWM32433.1 hypothetical protein DDQ68_06290 [Hymenobacter nivis]
MSRETILAAINALPADVNASELEETLERLVFMAKVEEGIRQSEQDETISQEALLKLVQTREK